MDRKKFLIVGSGGREGIFATRLMEDAQLYAIMSHKNPSIIHCVERSGGEYAIGDANDPQAVLGFAREHGIDYTFVNADQPLANGVVDVLLENGFKAIGGTKAATRIEWDKVYSIGVMQKVCPEFTPFHRIVSSAEEVEAALSEFKSKGIDVVVKPQGLTGGKGVKVMPEHLPTYQDCAGYACLLLERNGSEKVLLVERLEGIEFTIMGITDGRTLVACPASYDYPFRYDDDRGAGTGGMGCFTNSEKRLPFMSGKDLDDCRYIMQTVIDEMESQDHPFIGVLNGGFFKTKNGIRFMEFNGRFGDPEVLNILSVLKGSFSELLVHVWNKTLSEDAVSFDGMASVVKYMVAKEYPDASSNEIHFTLDEKAIAGLGVKTFFASCVRTGDHRYKTLKKSRAVAFCAVSEMIPAASSLVDRAIDTCLQGKLEYRRDIGSERNLQKLDRINANLGA